MIIVSQIQQKLDSHKSRRSTRHVGYFNEVKDRYNSEYRPDLSKNEYSSSNELPPQYYENCSENRSRSSNEEQYGRGLSIIREDKREYSTKRGSQRHQKYDNNSDDDDDDNSNESPDNIHSKNIPSTKAGKIHRILKETKKGLHDCREQVKIDIEDAMTEKEEWESDLENLSIRPQLWRSVRRKIKFLAMFRKDKQMKKIFGDAPYLDNDPEVKRQKLMRNPVIIYEQTKKRKKCLIYEDSKIKLIWNFIQIWLFLYTAFVTPLRLSVIESDDTYWHIIEMSVNILFFFDIIINLFSVEDGIEDRCQIFRNYLFSWLIFDTIAVIPMNYMITNEKVSSLNKLAKVPRLLRLFRVARIFQMTSKIKKAGIMKQLNDFFNLNAGIVKLLQFFCSMFVVTHITGCVWLYIAKLFDYGPGTWVYEERLDSEDKLLLYLNSVYWAISTISTVGFGDVHAYNVGKNFC